MSGEVIGYHGQGHRVQGESSVSVSGVVKDRDWSHMMPSGYSVSVSRVVEDMGWVRGSQGVGGGGPVCL